MVRDQAGIALILTLAVVSLLTAITIRLAVSVDAGLQEGRALLEQQRLDAVLFSGLSLARAALYADQAQGKSDTLADGWNEWDRDKLDALFPGDRLRIQVRDLSGRIQVNGLVARLSERADRQEQEKARRREQRQRELWMRFLLSGRFAVEDEEQARILVDSLADWIDPDSESREYGAESPYYQGLSKPYPCRNAPLPSVDELSLIRGFDRAVLYGDSEHEGILAYLTVRGRDGRININTAPVAVLAALAPELDEDAVSALDDFRRDPENVELLARPDWYRQAPGFPGDLTLDPALVTVSSRYFMVRIRAGANGLRRLGLAELERDPVRRSQTLLGWLSDWNPNEERKGGSP